MRATIAKLACGLAVLGLSGVTFAADPPKRDPKVEAVLDKLAGKSEFDDKSGSYRVTWKDRPARWHPSGSDAAKGADGVFECLVPVATQFAAEDAAGRLVRQPRLTAARAVMPGTTTPAVAVRFPLKGVPTADELQRLSDTAMGETEKAVQVFQQIVVLLDKKGRIEKAIDDIKFAADSLPREIEIVQGALDSAQRDLDDAFRNRQPSALLSTIVSRYRGELSGLKAKLRNAQTNLRRAESDLRSMNAEIDRIAK